MSRNLSAIENLWNRSIKIALTAKNKFSFVDGSFPRPDGVDPNLLATWERNNNFDTAWILNLVSKEILASIIYNDTASDIWKDLKDHYQQQNGPRSYKLKGFCESCSRINDCNQYFTAFKTLWEELSDFCPNCNCNCGGAKPLLDYIQ